MIKPGPSGYFLEGIALPPSQRVLRAARGSRGLHCSRSPLLLAAAARRCCSRSPPTPCRCIERFIHQASSKALQKWMAVADEERERRETMATAMYRILGSGTSPP